MGGGGRSAGKGSLTVEREEQAASRVTEEGLDIKRTSRLIVRNKQLRELLGLTGDVAFQGKKRIGWPCLNLFLV